KNQKGAVGSKGASAAFAGTVRIRDTRVGKLGQTLRKRNSTPPRYQDDFEAANDIPYPTRTPKQMASSQLCCNRPKGKAAIRPNKIAFTVSRLMARLLACMKPLPAHGRNAE